MYSKIIHPHLHGKGQFANKGSCRRLLAYLQHETSESGGALLFFSDRAENISPQQVAQQIDGNAQGLGKRESKFISLVLSPSQEELRHIGGDPWKLMQFTRKVMQQYAATFQLKGGKALRAEQLLWFAAIHRERTYKAADLEVRQGLQAAGTPKPGEHLHVHVLVSKRDRAQQLKLSPFGNRERFDMLAWQRESKACFNGLFHYLPQEQKASPGMQEVARQDGRQERLQARIREKVMHINGYLDRDHQLEPERVLAVAQEGKYHRTFFLNLNRLEAKLRKEHYVRDPMHLLEHNRDRKPEQRKVQQGLSTSLKQLLGASRGMGFTESLEWGEAGLRKRGKGVKRGV